MYILKLGLNSYKYLRALAQKNDEARIIVAYEASPLGFGIYDDSVEAGIECHILAPTKMPKAAKDRKRKYDERDAQVKAGVFKDKYIKVSSFQTA